MPLKRLRPLILSLAMLASTAGFAANGFAASAKFVAPTGASATVGN